MSWRSKLYVQTNYMLWTATLNQDISITHTVIITGTVDLTRTHACSVSRTNADAWLTLPRVVCTNIHPTSSENITPQFGKHHTPVWIILFTAVNATPSGLVRKFSTFVRLSGFCEWKTNFYVVLPDNRVVGVEVDFILNLSEPPPSIIKVKV